MAISMISSSAGMASGPTCTLIRGLLDLVEVVRRLCGGWWNLGLGRYVEAGLMVRSCFSEGGASRGVPRLMVSVCFQLGIVVALRP